MKKLTLPLLALLTLYALPAAYADERHHPAESKSSATASATTLEMSEAEVRKIDKSANKITLKHGEIKNLDMPGMTMVFRVKDPAMLDPLQNGDKIRFRAERVKGVIVVTEIEPLK